MRSLIVTFIWLSLCSVTTAQISPNYLDYLKQQDKEREAEPQVQALWKLRTAEYEGNLQSYFQSFPSKVHLATMKGDREKAELELVRSGVQVLEQTGTPPYISLRYEHGAWPEGGDWYKAKLIVHEFVLIDREGTPVKVSCDTYRDEGDYCETQHEAERDMWQLLNRFCLLYVKNNRN